MPGHDFGHPPQPPQLPDGLDWALYVQHFREAAGGWTALTDNLIRHATGVIELPDDPGSIEKGLRRLAKRAHKPGGDYGRWMLRFFGVPPDAEAWARWIAQYHSRFADLPASLRLSHIGRWDRPPISESKISAWIDVGLASALGQLGDGQRCLQRLERAEAGAERAGPAAGLEVRQYRAFLSTNDGDRATARRLFDECEPLLEHPELGDTDRLCYSARLLVQRAYHLTKPVGDVEPDLRGAMAMFERIEENHELPFVSFRRCSGLAYCHWKLGDTERGIELARLAAQHAGDGGLVRFRVMALNLLSRMVPEPEASAVKARAIRLANHLEDEGLMARVRPREP